MGARRRCCCNCLIGQDTFERPDSDDLSDDLWPPLWQSGDWDIYDETAQQNESAGRAAFWKRHPVPDESMVAYLDTSDEQEGDVYEVIVNWKDPDNYHFARLVIEDRGQAYLEGVLSLWSVTDGVETSLVDKWIGELTGSSRTIIAKISDGGFCAMVLGNANMGVWEYTTLIPEGYYAGMGAAGRVGIRVDNFYSEQHLHTKSGCPYCWCKCDGRPFPKQVRATIVDATGRMAGAEGCEILLNYITDSPITWETPFAGKWHGTAADCCGYWELLLRCALEYNVEGFALSVLFSCNTTPGGEVPLYPLEGSTCSPLYLRYGPFLVGRGDFTCFCGEVGIEDGSYYVEITE